MFMWKVIWLLSAAAVAVVVVSDMRRLMVNRAGLSRAGWVLVCACAGPFAAAIYLVQRRAVRRALINAVWRVVGDREHPVQVRRERLIALRRNGMVGAPIFRTCMEALDREPDTGTSPTSG